MKLSSGAACAPHGISPRPKPLSKNKRRPNGLLRQILLYAPLPSGTFPGILRPPQPPLKRIFPYSGSAFPSGLHNPRASFPFLCAFFSSISTIFPFLQNSRSITLALISNQLYNIYETGKWGNFFQLGHYVTEFVTAPCYHSNTSATAKRKEERT